MVINTYTVTYHHEHNYGAMLQAFALQQFLKKQGYNNKIIDYQENKNKIFINPLTKSTFKGMLQGVLDDIFILSHYREHKNAFRCFEAFYMNNLERTPYITQINELEQFDNENSIFIAGSDQLWNIKQNSPISKYHFLQFVKLGKKCSYAVSMGESFNYQKGLIENLETVLSGYKSISVREKGAYDYLSKIGLKCCINIDPVFLIERTEWEKLISSNRLVQGRYILCYDLVKAPLMQYVIDLLKKEYGYKVIVLTTRPHTNIKGDIYIRSAGPIEFLNLMYYASTCVTSSFHGIAFSLIFNKDFYAVLGKHSPNRIVELLKLFNLDNRIIREKGELQERIDYDDVNDSIEIQCQKTVNYFKELVEV